MGPTDQQAQIRPQYGSVADRPACGGGNWREASKAIGYSDQQVDRIPAEANLGLGCGNPLAIASLQLGQRVIDVFTRYRLQRSADRQRGFPIRNGIG